MSDTTAPVMRRRRGRARLGVAGRLGRRGRDSRLAAEAHGERGEETGKAGEGEGRRHAEERRRAEQQHRRHGRAEIAREGVEGEGAAHPRAVDPSGEQRIIGRVVDAIGEPRRRHRHDEHRIARHHRQHEEARPAENEPGREHPAMAEAVADKAHRALHDQRDEVEHGQRRADLEEAAAEMTGQQRQQRRHDHDVDVADPMGERDLRQQPALGADRRYRLGRG